MDPSRIWRSTCSGVPSNLLSAGLMRASRSLQSTPERTQGYPQETETQVPRHQNFIPQWSTTVPLPSRSPPRAGLLLTPVDSVLQWRCKASAPCTHTWAVPANLEQSRLFWALIPHESQQVELIPAGPLAPSPLSWQDAEIRPASPAGAAG